MQFVCFITKVLQKLKLHSSQVECKWHAPKLLKRFKCGSPSKTTKKEESWCHNLSLGLATKVRVCKGASQKGSPGITSQAPGSVGDYEGMNPHTPR